VFGIAFRFGFSSLVLGLGYGVEIRNWYRFSFRDLRIG